MTALRHAISAIWQAHSGAFIGFALLLLFAWLLGGCCSRKQDCVSLRPHYGTIVLLETPNPDAAMDDVLESARC